MSSCTFVIIKNGKAKYVTGHYSFIQNLIQGKSDPDKFREMSLYVDDGRLTDITDTGFMPSVIIDFDKKELVNTPFNWFDDFKQYLPIDWSYKELKVM